MGTIREHIKKSGEKSYHAEVRLKGCSPQRESFRTKSQAKDWIRSTEAAIRDGRLQGNVRSKKHIVNDIIDRYLSQYLSKQYKYYDDAVRILARWRKEIGHLSLRDLSSSQIVRVRDKLLAEKTSKGTPRNPATVNRYLSVFSKLLSVAAKEWELIEENPMRKVGKLKEGRGRDRYLSQDEMQALLNACKASSNPHLYSIVCIALYTGMRYGEIVNLRWRDISYNLRSITLRETKNGDCRVIPLTDEVEKIFKTISTLEKQPEQLIFASSSRRPSKHQMSIQKPFRKALKLAGIEGFRFHDLRHTCASYFAMGGLNQGELMNVLGHRSPQMTARYAHYSQTHLAEKMSQARNKMIGGNEIKVGLPACN